MAIHVSEISSLVCAVEISTSMPASLRVATMENEEVWVTGFFLA